MEEINSTRTEWFPCSIAPVHLGPYEADYWRGEPPCTRHWDGSWWLQEASDGTLIPAAFFGTKATHKWRGLAEPPAPVQAELALEEESL